MQEPTAGPRAALSAAAVVALIQDDPAITVGCGAELITPALEVIEDITGDMLQAGQVARQAYDTIHGSATLHLTRALDWGTAIVRPYLTIASSGTAARFNLGGYFTSVPKRTVQDDPAVYEVQGVDVLHALNTPVGDAYAVEQGVGYLTAVEEILTGQGLAYLIEQDAAASVLPSARVWPLDDDPTWLTVVNDLLAAVGYQGLWSDWDGRLRVTRYQTPRDRSPEWTYTYQDAASMLGQDRTVEFDVFDAPNRWVAVRSNNVDGPAPVEGNGVYTYVNELAGPTSVEARGGRIITRRLSLDVADHTALIARAQQSIDADMQIPTKLTVHTSPNPLHWHFDRLFIVDERMGGYLDVLGTAWTLPLDGGDMQHDWLVL